MPVDDGAADHLRGAVLPVLALASTAGRAVRLSELAAGRAVLFFYPRSGRPEEGPGPGWDAIPGARG